METIKLRNGAEESKAIVGAVIMSLNELLKKGMSGMLAAYDLVQVCRGVGKPFGKNGEILRDLSLLQPDGNVHDSIKNVILSATRGKDFELTFDSPFV